MLPILARTIFRLQERWLGRPTFSILRELDKSQYWPRERLEALRLERLREFVRGAYEHSPYWREVMDAHGIAPGAIGSLADLARFPLLEKPTLRARREEMVFRGDGKRVMVVRTSGSTNEALQFYTSSRREAHINAARIRGHRSVGVNKGDKELYFWASPVELSRQDRVKRFRDALINDALTNALEMSPERVPGFIAQWKRGAKCIFGYPSSFVLLADMAKRAGIDLKELQHHGLKVLCTTSEMLGEVSRKVISEAFGLPVYDSYGARECGLIGHECTHFTMHTNDEQLILETIDPDTLQPTEGEGELVATSLFGHVMPVIRYRTGDIVKLSKGPCPCGRTLHGVVVSGGRAVDFIVTREGTWVAGYSFIYIARSTPGVVKFQVLQDKVGEVRVLLATDGNFPADGVERVKAATRARLASSDEIVVELVDDIRPAPSGKYRPVISKVAEELRRAGRVSPA